MKLLQTIAVLALATASAPAVPWHFEFFGGEPHKLVWETELGPSYYLFQSADLRDWIYVPTFPQPGTGGEMQHSFTPGARGFFRIIPAAPAPEGMVLIPAGSFVMGDQSNPLVGYSDERPAHTVYVSAFYMSKYEVTKELWDSVRAWGITHGYTDLPAGSKWDGTNHSKGPDHPVHSVDWYAMVKWCNARSQKEGLAPCYRVAGAIYKTAPDSIAVACDWNAQGYRLPTEAEWEKAARGWAAGRNFPWGDIINHSYANYYNAYYSYESPQNQGFHPTYAVGDNPYTSPVGSFAPNGYGLYDMTGNVWEWCWDWWSSTYYSTSPGSDPRGAASGTARVGRGGSWDDGANYCRTAIRYGYYPLYNDNSRLGFRLARSSVP